MASLAGSGAGAGAGEPRAPCCCPRALPGHRGASPGEGRTRSAAVGHPGSGRGAGQTPPGHGCSCTGEVCPSHGWGQSREALAQVPPSPPLRWGFTGCSPAAGSCPALPDRACRSVIAEGLGAAPPAAPLELLSQRRWWRLAHGYPRGSRCAAVGAGTGGGKGRGVRALLSRGQAAAAAGGGRPWARRGSPGLGRGARCPATVRGAERWHAGDVASGSPAFLLLQPLPAGAHGQRCRCCILRCPHPARDPAGCPAERGRGCGGPTLEESGIPSFPPPLTFPLAVDQLAGPSKSCSKDE